MDYDFSLTLLHEQVEPILHKAAQIQRNIWRSGMLAIAYKDDGSSICKADIATEQLLKHELAKIFKADFYAEESGISGSGPYHWVIDPLDGTTNYVSGLPYFGISVALTYEHVTIWGGIFNPLTDDFIYATKQKGAFFNGKRLAFQDAKSLFIPIITDVKQDVCSHIAHSLVDYNIFFRNLGASSLDQAYVAAIGTGAVVYSQKRGWWDVAAGILIMTESGGVVTDLQGNSVKPSFTSYIAGSPLIHGKLLHLLKSCSS